MYLRPWRIDVPYEPRNRDRRFPVQALNKETKLSSKQIAEKILFERNLYEASGIETNLHENLLKIVEREFGEARDRILANRIITRPMRRAIDRFVASMWLRNPNILDVPLFSPFGDPLRRQGQGNTITLRGFVQSGPESIGNPHIVAFEKIFDRILVWLSNMDLIVQNAHRSALITTDRPVRMQAGRGTTPFDHFPTVHMPLSQERTLTYTLTPGWFSRTMTESDVFLHNWNFANSASVRWLILSRGAVDDLFVTQEMIPSELRRRGANAELVSMAESQVGVSNPLE